VLEYLRCCGWGPFLVVAPLTTLVHWQREAQKWTSMNAVVYDGTAEDREIIRDTEWHLPGGGRRRSAPHKFDLLLVAYETMRKDEGGHLSGVGWGAIVCDEAHKLKNTESALFKALRGKFSARWLLLLTGTPVQARPAVSRPLLDPHFRTSNRTTCRSSSASCTCWTASPSPAWASSRSASAPAACWRPAACPRSSPR